MCEPDIMPRERPGHQGPGPPRDPGPGSHSPGPHVTNSGIKTEIHISPLICVTMGPGSPVIQNVPGSLIEHKNICVNHKRYFPRIKNTQYQVI